MEFTSQKTPSLLCSRIKWPNPCKRPTIAQLTQNSQNGWEKILSSGFPCPQSTYLLELIMEQGGGWVEPTLRRWPCPPHSRPRAVGMPASTNLLSKTSNLLLIVISVVAAKREPRILSNPLGLLGHRACASRDENGDAQAVRQKVLRLYWDLKSRSRWASATMRWNVLPWGEQ